MNDDGCMLSEAFRLWVSQSISTCRLIVVIVDCDWWRALSGAAALPAGSVTTTAFPELPADHLGEARKLVISRQMLLIALITLIVLALPALALGSGLPSSVQAVIVTYDGVAAAYAAAYTFSDRGKPKGR